MTERPKPLTLEEGIAHRLRETRGPVAFADLAEHLARDGLFIVAASVDLIACGVAIATDDVDRVRTWIGSGELRKPTQAERDHWRDHTPLDLWTAVIVQPFVLVQREPDA